MRERKSFKVEGESEIEVALARARLGKIAIQNVA